MEWIGFVFLLIRSFPFHYETLILRSYWNVGGDAAHWKTNIPTRLIIQMQCKDIIWITRILHAIIWSNMSNISHYVRAARDSDVIKRRRKSGQAAIANNSLKQSLFRGTYNDFLVFNFKYIWSRQRGCLWKLSRKICGIWERVCCALLSR